VIRLARTGLLATLAAMVATGLGAALAAAAGVSLEVQGGELPATGIAFVTAVFSLVGVALAAVLLRWGSRPDAMFVRIAVGLTGLSLVPPLAWANDAATTVTLIALHLVAAGIVVPPLARSLRSEQARPAAEERLSVRSE
jgi:hypothetical protein